MAELMHQYVGFPLGVADASVLAVAERLKASKVATLTKLTPGIREVQLRSARPMAIPLTGDR